MSHQKDYLREKSITAIKMLGVQAVNAANSGHPGIVLGAAPMAYAIFSDHLQVDPKNPQWINRDRFILSAGHGSALLYSLLHLSGYDLKLEELKRFRQIGSLTPGHPEAELTVGVEATTGPLGQGLAMAVGCALNEKFISRKYNKPHLNIIDYHTYVIVSDGDLQEGISQEAISLAGHWKLNKLIALYDSNDIQLDGPINTNQSEMTKLRFESNHWNYILVTNGQDFNEISKAISEAKKSDRPTLIEVKTIIGVDASKQGTSGVHGAPLGEDIKNVQAKLKWDYEPFFVPEDVKHDFNERVTLRGFHVHQTWKNLWKEYEDQYLEAANELVTMIDHNYHLITQDFEELLTINDDMATRDCSGKILKIIGDKLPLFLGGSADLASSTKASGVDGNFSHDNPNGRNIMFGVREFGMTAITNGMLLQRMTRTFASTFLIFSDYAKPAIRLAALMQIPNIFVFSHDSVAVGEDGPTHQPVEQIAMLRTTPNLNVFRPCDMKETIASYISALNSQRRPTAILVSRQKLPQINGSDVNKALKGGYVISPENESLKLILIATGSEVQLALKVQTELLKQNILGVRVVSMPSMLLFDEQDKIYQQQVLPKGINKVSLEMGTTALWHKYVDQGITIGIDEFGTSAPMEDVMDKFGFNVGNIVTEIKALLI